MSVDLVSPDAMKALNTTPLVEPDGAGGHVPYVREDTTPTTDYAPAAAAQIRLLRSILAVMKDIRDECRATRIGVQERLNEGNFTQHDLLEMAQSVRDSAEEA